MSLPGERTSLVCERCDESFSIPLAEYYAGGAIDHATGEQLCPMHMTLAHLERVARFKIDRAMESRRRQFETFVQVLLGEIERAPLHLPSSRGEA